jgi:hypothetical protein
MTMNTLMRSLIAIAVLMALTGSASAQTYNTTTTLTTAITDRNCTNRTLTVGSTSGWAAGMQFYMDSELFNVNSVPSSTTVVASRCVASTPPELHAASSVIFWGPVTMFQVGATDGLGRKLFGRCTVTDYAYLPLIDILTGNVYLCRAFGTAAPNTSAQWTWTNNQLGTYNSLLKNLN